MLSHKYIDFSVKAYEENNEASSFERVQRKGGSFFGIQFGRPLPFKKGRVRAQPDGFGCGGGEAANLLIL